MTMPIELFKHDDLAHEEGAELTQDYHCDDCAMCLAGICWQRDMGDGVVLHGTVLQ